MFDWTDLGDILDAASRAYGIFSNFDSSNRAADLRDRANDLDIATARARAIFSQESANLQAEFMRMQGDAAFDVGEFNARIYEQEGEIALDLAARDKELIKDNAEIQKVIDVRSYRSFLSSQVASVAGAGITLSGSAVEVMLDSAAVMDYTLATKAWAAQEAITTRDIQGNLQNWEAQVGAVRERYMGTLQRALSYAEADMTEHLGALAAEMETAGLPEEGEG